MIHSGGYLHIVPRNSVTSVSKWELHMILTLK